MNIEEEIKALKNKLDSATTAGNALSADEILKLSQMLDKLIVKYYKEIFLDSKKGKNCEYFESAPL